MKAGDYVRTNSGWICKLGYYNDEENRWITFYENDWFPVYESEIKIYSPNIIDLIEIGDYVNGIKVDFTNTKDKLSYEDKCIGFYDGDGDITLFENDIKTILTKEQFESMEYKIGE